MRLVRLHRFLLFGGVVLVLLGLILVCGTSSNAAVQVMLPRWTGDIAPAGLMLFVISQLIDALNRRGWRRIVPLAVAIVVTPTMILVVWFILVNAQRLEIDRVTLANGRVVMMTLEPGLTDAVFRLWEPQGWQWRSLFENGGDITYSEDHSFTSDPRLVVSDDGRYLLIRRGGIWTDCWTTGTTMRSCLPEESRVPMTDSEWLGRSARIAAVVRMDPSLP